MDVPEPDDVRAALAVLDARQRAVVGGLVAVLIQHPERVRDREWVAEQLTLLTLMVREGDADDPAAAVERTREYLALHARHLVEVSYRLYGRLGLDLAEEGREGGPAPEDVLARMKEYLAAD
jgi:hypothetical protein